jgi:gas vesicle protein
MKRLAVGATLGGLAAYFYDPELGSDRRERLYSVWKERRDTVVQAGQKAAGAMDAARPVASRVTKAIGRRELAQLVGRRRRRASVPMLVGAAAVGGAAMYFLDPVRGSERRRSTIVAGRRMVNKVVDSAKTVRGRMVGPSTESGRRAKSQVG